MRKAQEKLDTLKQYSGYQVSQALEEEDDDQLECMGNAGGVQVPNETSEEEDEAVPPQTGTKRTHSVSQHPDQLAVCINHNVLILTVADNFSLLAVATGA